MNGSYKGALPIVGSQVHLRRDDEPWTVTRVHTVGVWYIRLEQNNANGQKRSREIRADVLAHHVATAERSDHAGASTDVLAAFGDRLRGLRVDKGLSQEDLARLSGLHYTYISDVERGQRNIGLVNLWRLAVALKMPIGELVGACSNPEGNDS